MVSKMVSTVDGTIRDGVPPPKKTVETVRPGTRAAVLAISAANARTKRASWMPPRRTELLKSQSGHSDRQNGQCTYPPTAGASSLACRRAAVIVSAAGKAGPRQLEKGAGAVRQALAPGRQPVLLVGTHLAEGARVAIGQEHRVVAKTFRAARRPYERPVDAGLEFLQVPVRPRDAQRRDEMRAPLVRRIRAAARQLLLDLTHRAGKVLVRPGPARRMNAGRAAEGVDRKPGIVGEGGQAGRASGGFRLDARVLAKARSGLFRLSQAERARRHRLDAERRQQLAHLLQLAGIVGGNHQAAVDAAMRHDVPAVAGQRAHYITAIFCRSTSLAMPLRASASRASNCSSLNGA